MKNSILFAALFLLINNAFGQRANTEVYILGNIHDSVPNYNPTILLAIMNDIKPDIILHEVDREGMSEYEANAIAFKGNEIQASNAYLQQNPGLLRFPFDYEDRNNYRRNAGMVPTDNLTVRLIDSLFNTKKLTIEEEHIYSTFKNITNELMNIAALAPEHFNNAKTDSLAEKRQRYQYNELLKITNRRSEFSERFVTKPDGEKISYKDGFERMAGFWDLRNQTMAQNIYDISLQYPGKKILVLTGFLHRYYLIKELTKLNQHNFEIKEFYHNASRP